MTRIRTSSNAWLAIGVLLIGSTVIIRWMVVPALTKLPADLNQGQRYEGSMSAFEVPPLLGRPFYMAPVSSDWMVSASCSSGWSW
jgi:hypothetical protein